MAGALISALVETEAVVQACEECGKNYRTYVPRTVCIVPGGESVFYSDPQTKCPLCDENGFRHFMNVDLFPELETV